MSTLEELRRQLEDLAELVEGFLAIDGAALLKDLSDDPDDETVDRALRFLRDLRDMLANEKTTFKLARLVRGSVVSTLTTTRPEMKMSSIASAAGFNGSMASKEARRHGSKPRTYRSPNATGS